MDQKNDKIVKEIPLNMLKYKEATKNVEKSQVKKSPIQASSGLPQNSQFQSISKDDFISKLLQDKQKYTKAIKQFENKQPSLKTKMENPRNNQQASTQSQNVPSSNCEQQNEGIDNYASPTFKISDSIEDEVILDNNSSPNQGDKLESCLLKNNDDQFIYKIRNSSFFEVSFSEDHFQASPSDYISPALQQKKEIQKKLDEENNFYELGSEDSSLSSSSSSSMGYPTQSHHMNQKSDNQNNMQFPYKQNEMFSFRIGQEANQLETINECIDEIRSSENLNLKTIQDEDEEEEEERPKSGVQQQQLQILQQQKHSMSSSSSIHSNPKCDSDKSKKQVNLLQYIESKVAQKSQEDDNSKDYQERLQMRFNIKQFEKQFSSLNHLSSSSSQKQTQLQNFVENGQMPEKMFNTLPEKIVSDTKLLDNSQGRRNNFHLNSEDLIDEPSSTRQQDSLFEVSNEGINQSMNQEEVNIIQKDQLIQNNMTRSKHLLGQIGSGSSQNEFQLRSSQLSSAQQSPLNQQQKSNKSNKFNNINVNTQMIGSSNNYDENSENFSPLKDRYLERIKSKHLTPQSSANASPSASPVKKSLSSYKKILTNKLVEMNSDNEQEQNEYGISQNMNQIFNEKKSQSNGNQIKIIQQDLQNSNSSLGNSNPLFLSPIEQKFTMSTQMSPRLSSQQEVENRIIEDQFNLSRSQGSQSEQSSGGGVGLLSNSLVQKKNQSQFSLKNQLSVLKSKESSNNDGFIKIEIAEDNHQIIKRNSVLTTSNESELNDDTEGVLPLQQGSSQNSMKNMSQNMQYSMQQNKQRESYQIQQAQQDSTTQSDFDINIIPITFQRLDFKSYDLSTPATQADNHSLIKQNNEIFIDQSPQCEFSKLVKDNKLKLQEIQQQQNMQQQQSQKVLIPPLKILEDKAKLTQKQQAMLEMYYNSQKGNKVLDEQLQKSVENLHKQAKQGTNQKYVVNTEEGSRSQQMSNNSQVDSFKKQSSVMNGINFLKVNIAKFKKTEKKQVAQSNNFLINNIFGKSLQEQRQLISKDSSPITMKTQVTQHSVNSGSANHSKDNSYIGANHHRQLKQVPAESFKKGTEKLNQQQHIRSKSNMNTNNSEKIMSFNEMYTLYKASQSKNNSIIINNQSQKIPNQKMVPNTNKSKSQDLKTKLMVTPQTSQQQIYNFMNSFNNSKEESANQSRDVSPQNSIIKEIGRKNSMNLIRRKDIHSGSPFKNAKKQELVYRSANISPVRKVSSQLMHGINQGKDIKHNSYHQIRRQTNPDLMRGLKGENKSALCQGSSYEQKSQVLLQKDFENFENAFRQYQRAQMKRNENQSQSLDSSLQNGSALHKLDNNNSTYNNPKMYTSLLSQIMNDQPNNVQQSSLLEQFQQNRKNSGLQNIKKLIYTQLKETNNTNTVEQKKEVSGVGEELKESKNQSNMIQQIYSKRFSQIL